MCRLRNIAMHDYQENVTIQQTHTHTQTDGQTDKVIPMCRYASQATQKVNFHGNSANIVSSSSISHDRVEEKEKSPPLESDLRI